MTVEFGWNEIEFQKDQIEVQYFLPEEDTSWVLNKIKSHY